VYPCVDGVGESTEFNGRGRQKLRGLTLSRIELTALYRYPVKSLAGQSVESLTVGPRGPDLDRHWMLVDLQGRFVTQRQQPRMALIHTSFSDAGGLSLKAPGMPGLVVGEAVGKRIPVSVWRDSLAAIQVGADVDQWLSDYLGVSCQLVELLPDVRRPVDPANAAGADQIGFADGFPFLLISQASLDQLNGRLAEALPMRRFRPNLVVAGCPPHAEDEWRRIRIGELSFRVAKPCSRCGIPTIDLETAERSREPLETLLTYRRRDKNVYFGQYLIHDSEGHLAVGMPVEILE